MNPYSVQVEFVEGCNRMCDFCGIHSIWGDKANRELKFMDTALADAIALELGRWVPKRRIEFAMHGEPTLHPSSVSMVRMFRRYNPTSQLQMTTNGFGLRKNGNEYVKALFRAGLNILLVDIYAQKEETMAVCNASGIPVFDYYAPGVLNPYHNNGPDNKAIIIMGDLGAMTGVKAARKILNHAGNVTPEKVFKYNGKVDPLPLFKKCSRVFREMAIHHDGTVSVCCMDWRHEFVVGKAGSLKEIWESPIFQAVRYFTRQGKRLFRPCYKCDYRGGFRLGLLPKVENPFADDEEAILKIQEHLEVYDIHSRLTKAPFIKKGLFPL